MLGGDREAQAGAAAAPRRVGLVEPVEHVRQGLARDARARGRRPRSRRPRACGSATTSTGPSGAWSRALSRRLPRMRSRRRGSESTVTAAVGQGDGGGRQPGRDDRGHEPPEVDRLEASAARRPRRSGRSPSARRRASAAGGRRPPGARRRAARRASCPRCPSRSARPPPTSAVSGVRSSCDTSATNRRFCCWADSSRPTVVSSVVGHPVELRRPAPELVAPALGDARGQVAVGDPARGPRRRVHRPQDAARDEPGGDQRHERRPAAPRRRGRGAAGRGRPRRRRPGTRSTGRATPPGGRRRRAPARPASVCQAKPSWPSPTSARRSGDSWSSAPSEARRACTGSRRRSPRSCRRRRAA